MFHSYLTRMTGTLHDYQHIFMIISLSFLLRMRTVSNKVVEKIKTHISCSVTFFRKSCGLWDNVEKRCRVGEATDANITRHTHFASWITKATNTYSEYVILIASPWQQWLRGHGSTIHYTYTAYPVEHTFEHGAYSIQEWTTNYHMTDIVNVFFV